jgi:hypothetical protein
MQMNWAVARGPFQALQAARDVFRRSGLTTAVTQNQRGIGHQYLEM